MMCLFNAPHPSSHIPMMIKSQRKEEKSRLIFSKKQNKKNNILIGCSTSLLRFHGFSLIHPVFVEFRHLNKHLAYRWNQRKRKNLFHETKKKAKKTFLILTNVVVFLGGGERAV